MGRVKLIGVELEGGWNDLFDDVDITRDPSVQALNTVHLGEIQSPPLEYEPLIDWMEKHYPVAVNDHCGFHVHTSLKRTSDYSRLMDRGFYNYWLREVEKFAKAEYPDDHPFWPRFLGKNRFCMRAFHPERQVALAGKEDIRRTLLNFPYQMHKTMECRAFPAYPKCRDAVKAVKTQIDIIENYLESLPREEPTVVKVRLSQI